MKEDCGMSDVQMCHVVEKVARRHLFATEAGVIIREVLVAIKYSDTSANE